MNKHAYLIYAHNNFKILGVLLQSLDDERNDIFLHIDKKVKEFDVLAQELKGVVTRSKLYILENRVDVEWGKVSQIETELALYQEAINRGKYSYYHLLSGVDMPLRNQDEIHAFFDAHQGEEFISFSDETNYLERMQYIYPFPYYRGEWTLWAQIVKLVNKYFYRAQKLIGLNYTRAMKGDVKVGANWCSLTDEAVRYIVEYMDMNFKWYRYATCPDEFYKQTALYNSDFRERVSNLGYLRLIDWQRGKPYIFTMEDYDMLINSNGALFVRKFDERVDFEIVNEIYREIVYIKTTKN